MQFTHFFIFFGGGLVVSNLLKNISAHQLFFVPGKFEVRGEVVSRRNSCFRKKLARISNVIKNSNSFDVTLASK